MFGKTYLGTIGNDMFVVKMTNSLPEYWLSKMSMVSNPQNVVKFHNVDVFDDSKFLYGIVHDYVSRDALPTAETWDMANKVVSGMMSEEKALSLLTTREQQSEYEQSKIFKKEIEKFFGFEIDTLQQNIGYDDNKLVLFDLDGNVTSSKYEEFMRKYQ